MLFQRVCEVGHAEDTARDNTGLAIYHRSSVLSLEHFREVLGHSFAESTLLSCSQRCKHSVHRSLLVQHRFQVLPESLSRLGKQSQTIRGTHHLPNRSSTFIIALIS